MPSLNPYTSYYVNQAGTGLGSFEGLRYQRGRGFIGSVLKNAALPLLKYLGRQILSTGVGVASDVLDRGEPLKEAIKSRAKNKLKEVVGDAGRRATVFEQTGRGRKYRGRGSKRHKKLKNKSLSTTKRRAKSNVKLPLF